MRVPYSAGMIWSVSMLSFKTKQSPWKVSLACDSEDAAARVMVLAEEEVSGLKLKAVDAELSPRKGDGERDEEFLFEEPKDLNNVGFTNCREVAIVLLLVMLSPK